MKNAAIYFHPESYILNDSKVMGRQSAGEGFLQGFLRHADVEHFYSCAESKEHHHIFDHQVRQFRPSLTAQWIPQQHPHLLAKVGALFLPGPGIAAQAWLRRSSGEAAYSLTGVTHTTCTQRVMDEFGNAVIAPTHPWDAIICTSRSVQQTIRQVWGDYTAYLTEKFGVPIPPPAIQLPIIPLGVDSERFAPSAINDQARAHFRQQFNIAEDDIVVLFVGRISFHAKAHPMPMYLGLETAARKTKRRIHLIQAGQFANQFIRAEFVDGARKLCPSVNAIFVGHDEVKNGIWFAADIFTSLSDNIQETFGLTPIEAMAAGLPIVASDWDGYRDTIEHGVTGILVPTIMPPPGCGTDIAYRHASGMDNYDKYIGHVSQCVSVDIRGTAEAFITLIENPDLRRSMSEAGRKRAKDVYDWKNIIQSYQQLWEELSICRAAASDDKKIPKHQPLRGDPFRVFSSYPTALINGENRVTLLHDDPVAHFANLISLPMNTSAAIVLSDANTCKAILETLKTQRSLSVSQLLQAFPQQPPPVLLRTLAWMAKLGLITLTQEQF